MIDHTSSNNEQHQTALRRENRRRYAFQRMLAATDRLLGRVEELNRDGVKTVPKRVRTQIRDVVGAMPLQVREALRDTGKVQDTLDSLFEVQERLCRWRFPGWHAPGPAGEHDAVLAS